MHDSLRETIETEVDTHVEDYGDLIVQDISTRVVVFAAALPQALPINATIGEHDVMGEVDRYGADEGVLLGQRLRGLDVSLHGTASAEATVEFEYRFGFDSGRLDYSPRNRLEDGINDGNNVSIVATDQVNNDDLYIVSGTVEAGHRDTVNGTGAGAAPFRSTDDETNYLTDIGVMPEVTARETLFENLFVSNAVAEAPDDVALFLYSNWQLFWLETDDEIEGRQIDVV